MGLINENGKNNKKLDSDLVNIKLRSCVVMFKTS